MVMDFNTLYNIPFRFDRLIDEFFKSPEAEGRRLAYPPLNLSSDDANFYVRAEIPGVDIKDIELTLTDKTLVIKGERQTEQGRYYRQERPAGVFHRVVTIGAAVDREKVSASMTNGVLTVVLPKSEHVKPKKISIEAA